MLYYVHDGQNHAPFKPLSHMVFNSISKAIHKSHNRNKGGELRGNVKDIKHSNLAFPLPSNPLPFSFSD